MSGVRISDQGRVRLGRVEGGLRAGRMVVIEAFEGSSVEVGGRLVCHGKLVSRRIEAGGGSAIEQGSNMSS